MGANYLDSLLLNFLSPCSSKEFRNVLYEINSVPPSVKNLEKPQDMFLVHSELPVQSGHFNLILFASTPQSLFRNVLSPLLTD